MVQWLIHWTNSTPEEGTWEIAGDIEEQFPTFDPWGQGSSQAGGIDTSINNMEGSQTKKVNEGEEKGMESAKEREAETYADSPDELAN